MYGMTAFMNHCCNIMHLSSCIHEYKWCTCFCQRAIITAWRLTDPAFKVKAVHFFHRPQAVCKERPEVTETAYCFFQEFISCLKRIQRLLVGGFGIHIPGP